MMVRQSTLKKKDKHQQGGCKFADREKTWVQLLWHRGELHLQAILGASPNDFCVEPLIWIAQPPLPGLQVADSMASS